VSRSHLASVVSLLVLSTGCRPDLGQADPDAAREVVYDRDGVPAYAGQALVIQSCGAGGFCHSEGIEPSERFGAPAGLDFDLRLASVTAESEDEASFRLLAHRALVIQHAGAIGAQVAGGEMPPSGAVGDLYRASTAIEYTRFDDSGADIGPLPGLDTEEGREILRNWLAMGDALPVVERTLPRLGGEEPVTGDVVSACERNCVDPTFESIYEQIFLPTCGLSRCHDSTDPSADLDLAGAIDAAVSREDRVGVMSSVLEGMVGAEARGSQCRGRNILLVRGDATRSLLYAKVAATSSEDVCGSRMPLAGNPLSEQRLCAIREWIACGACGPNDSSCDACVASARTTCGVAAPFDPATGQAVCANVPRCANRAEPTGM
jgi:hypothetical protein